MALTDAPSACPLCGLPRHRGKCSRLPKGEWWCGLCLTETLSPSDLAAATPLTAATLISAGIERTSKWCVGCGTPVCSKHRGTKQTVRCVVDCRRRLPSKVATLKATLVKYVPDYLTAGPQRCRVCALPAYKTSLCGRHYAAVRRGDLELYVERQRRTDGARQQCVSVYLPPAAYEAAKSIAEAEGVSTARWLGDVIKAEVTRLKGLNFGPEYVVIPGLIDK